MTSLDRRSFLKTTAAGLASVTAVRGQTRPANPANEDPLGVRAEFPITETQAYLNTASSGHFPRAVKNAAQRFVEEKTLRPTPGSRQETRARARAKFANLFGAKEEEVAFLYSTSDGENIVARDWSPWRGSRTATATGTTSAPSPISLTVAAHCSTPMPSRRSALFPRD